MPLEQLLINYNRKVLTSLSWNIKNCQQHLLFYHPSNKIFLRIASKPKSLGH